MKCPVYNKSVLTLRNLRSQRNRVKFKRYLQRLQTLKGANKFYRPRVGWKIILKGVLME